MRTITIIDGPDDKPNRRREVIPFCKSPTPGFVFCIDIDTEELLTVHRSKLRGEHAQNQIQEAAPASANAS